MSRYGFNVDDVEIVVGWDNPTRTFFGQTEVDGREVINTMLGMGLFNIQSVDLLENMIGFYIPRDIRKKLLDDQAESPPPTPQQSRMAKIFKPMLERTSDV